MTIDTKWELSRRDALLVAASGLAAAFVPGAGLADTATISGCGSVNITTSNAVGSSSRCSAKSTEAGSGPVGGTPAKVRFSEVGDPSG